LTFSRADLSPPPSRSKNQICSPPMKPPHKFMGVCGLVWRGGGCSVCSTPLVSIRPVFAGEHTAGPGAGAQHRERVQEGQQQACLQERPTQRGLRCGHRVPVHPRHPRGLGGPPPPPKSIHDHSCSSGAPTCLVVSEGYPNWVSQNMDFPLSFRDSSFKRIHKFFETG